MAIEELKVLLKFNNTKGRYIFNKKIISQLGLTPQEAYDYLHPDKIKYCPICNIKTKFRNFSLGYSESCATHKNKVAHMRSVNAIERIYGTRDPLSIKNGRTRGNYKCIHSDDVAAKRIETCLERYGVPNTFLNKQIQDKAHETKRNNFKDPVYRQSVIDKGNNTHFKHYECYYTQTEEYKKRHRNTRHQNRLRRELGKSTTYKEYRRLVDQFTKALDVSLLENSDKRGLCGVQGAYQLDHMYSVKDGYINDVPPHIVGSLANVRFIPWENNLAKSTRSSITKDELLGRYAKCLTHD